MFVSETNHSKASCNRNIRYITCFSANYNLDIKYIINTFTLGIKMVDTWTIHDYDEIFKDDKLNIKSNVIDFAHLIEQDTYKTSSTSKVYSLSAKFGIGKTFFCNKLQQVLAKDKVKVGKLNIWEMDFYDNPFIPILAELNKLYNNKGKKLPAKIIDSVSKFSSKTLASLCEISAKVASNVALGVDATEVCKEKFTSETIYDDYNEYQRYLKELKDQLTKWSSKQSDSPIVIIIDELDRCKPDYAVKTLEVLKHFFDVPGFVFVLALDEEQLKNSVQTLFGTIDYEGYKRKFISNSFMLPEPDRLSFAEYLYEKSEIKSYIEKIQQEKRELVFMVDIYNSFYCAHTYSHHGDFSKEEIAKRFNLTQTSESIIKRYFAAYSELFGFSLRKMEQVFDRLVLFVKQISAGKELFSPDLATFLICLHEGDTEIFNHVKNIDNCSIGIIEKIFSHTTNSVAYSIYKETAFKKFKTFNRNIAPEVIDVAAYSYYANRQTEQLQRIIQDNIDRFYKENPENWMYEQGAIKNRNILSYNSKFDKEKFKENYCKHIDFIAHFD